MAAPGSPAGPVPCAHLTSSASCSSSSSSSGSSLRRRKALQAAIARTPLLSLASRDDDVTLPRRRRSRGLAPGTSGGAARSRGPPRPATPPARPAPAAPLAPPPPPAAPGAASQALSSRWGRAPQVRGAARGSASPAIAACHGGPLRAARRPRGGLRCALRPSE